MIRSYFKIILRQLRSLYSLINLTGLTIGFTAFILIYLWVAFELSYDKFHQSHSNIYRVTENQFNDKGEVYPVAITPGPLGPYLINNFGEIANTCRLVPVELLLRHEETSFYYNGIAADSSLFKVFSFRLVQGELASFYNGADKIIISEKVAAAFFGQVNPIGKIFQVVGRDLVVTGVLKDIPLNSHLQFDYVLPFNFLEVSGLSNTTSWDFNRYHTYITLKENADPGNLAHNIREVIKEHLPESHTQLALQPLTEIHLKSGHLNNDMPGRGNYQYVLIFSGISIFILIIASVNYANLATARSLKRAKETGIRKVIGASRVELISLFFLESLLYATVSFLLATVAAWLLLPSYNLITGKDLSLQLFSPASLTLPIISVLFCALVGGAYPAVFLSMLNPVSVFKGYVRSSKQAVLFRRALVIFQFALSILFLAGMLLVQKQLNYIQSRNLGFNKENILTFSANRKLRQQYNEFKNELLTLSGVNSVTASNSKLSFSDQSTHLVEWEGKNPSADLLFHLLSVDYDFAKTYSIEVVAGRDFSNEIFSDSTAALLNEEAIRQMGLSDPLNKQITVDGYNATIIGIVKDFNFKSAHKKIEPMVIYIDPSSFYEVSVRLAAGDLHAQAKAVEQVYKKFNPDRPFEYTFLDEEIDKLYRDEQRTGKVFQYFALFSIIISCLGLLGMSFFITEQRTKEVAVRKVMGASAFHLTWLLTYEFIILVIVAFLLALPVMFYASDSWLDNFAYRVSPDIILFLIAGLVSLCVGWLTVGYRAYMVSKTNPVHSLRSE